jgi:hypothetical protein
MSRTRRSSHSPGTPVALLEPGRLGKVLDDVLGHLDERIAFHREQEALHAGKVDLHQAERQAHATELARLLAHREKVSHAAEATDDLAVSLPAPLVLQHEDFGPKTRPRIRKMVERLIQLENPETPIGSITLAQRINQVFGDRIQGRIAPEQVSAALRRLAKDGRLKIVRPGGSHRETLYGVRG